MPEEETSNDLLDEGGCQWRDEVVGNGHTWNPRVLPYGEVQCVTCTCKVRITLKKYSKHIFGKNYLH